MRVRLSWAQSVTAQGDITVPTTVAEEWKTIIFLRCSDPQLRAANPEITSSSEMLAKIRGIKTGTMQITTEMLRNYPWQIPATEPL